MWTIKQAVTSYFARMTHFVVGWSYPITEQSQKERYED